MCQPPRCLSAASQARLRSRGLPPPQLGKHFAPFALHPSPLTPSAFNKHLPDTRGAPRALTPPPPSRTAVSPLPFPSPPSPHSLRGRLRAGDLPLRRPRRRRRSSSCSPPPPSAPARPWRPPSRVGAGLGAVLREGAAALGPPPPPPPPPSVPPPWRSAAPGRGCLSWGG